MKFARANAWLVAVVLAHLVLRQLLASVGDGRGLVTPNGRVDPLLLALGAGALATRFVALFVVPAVAAYRVVVALVGRMLRSRSGEGQTS